MGPLPLTKLHPNERRKLAWYLFQEGNCVAARNAFYEDEPEAHRYTIEAIRSYSKTDLCAEEVRKYREVARENIDDAPYTHRNERIRVLTGVLARLLFRINKSEKPNPKDEDRLAPREFVALCSEVRATIREIGEHMLPLEDKGEGRKSFEEEMDETLEMVRRSSPKVAAFLKLGMPRQPTEPEPFTEEEN